MVTTRSGATSSKKPDNYSKEGFNGTFNTTMDYFNNTPPTVPGLHTRSQRKRKQSQISVTSESESNQTDEYQPPPNKKRKVQHQHIDTPLPQRRSTRIACKQSLNKNEFAHLDQVNEEIDNEEKDMSQITSIPNSLPRRRSLRLQSNGHNEAQDTANGHAIHPPLSHVPLKEDPHNKADNDWCHRLRRSARTNRCNSSNANRADEEEDDTMKRKRDSDYGDAEFEQDLQEEEINVANETEDAMNDADESEGDDGTRRRSQRLRGKGTIHYYNDGVDIRVEKEQPNEDEVEKSNSLPLSLRRPKRNRKPVVNIYEVEQYKAYKIKEDRRQSLRSKKPVNYAESPGSNDQDDSDSDALTTLSPSRSISYSASKRRRNRNRNRNRNRTRSRNRNRNRNRIHRRRRSYSSDSSSSYSTDTLMEIRAQKRIRKERRKIKPIQLHDLGLYDDAMAPNLKRQKHNKTDPADITPMEIDMNIGWDMVGGLEGHVQKLKEMVILPLLYPSEFAEFKMSTPRGVLFHGPPGTGKTLVARILAAQCSLGQNAKKVAFYMRKGADCLSKWVGEAERQLRLLFDEAHKNQPAVIFFDEIDGLAPVRSSRQDQIHSSIVSTLLALMDGLDSRGQIIVIGATNRPDAIDPALRRPGRFDRELCFNLPTKQARKEILKIHTKSWNETNCKLDDAMFNYLSEQSVGYCGADLEALCRESFLAAVRRTYPQIYHSNVRLQIDTKKLQIKQEDFEVALKNITPSSQRSSLVFARAIPELLEPLLGRQLQAIKRDIESVFHLKKDAQDGYRGHYRYLIYGKDHDEGQNYLGRAVLHLMEEYPMYSLDLASLYGDSTTKCADEAILRIFKEAQRNTPSVIYWPHIHRWWQTAHDILKTSITLLINDIAKDCPILMVATCSVLMEDLDEELVQLFEKFSFHSTDQAVNESERMRFWKQMTQCMKEKPKHKAPTIEQYPQLPIAELPPCEDGDNNNNNNNTIESKNQTESEALIEQQKMDCVNLRVYIRSVCNRLCKHFKNFIDQMAEDGVVRNHLSLFEIRQRNNERGIPTVVAFLNDIDELVQNVKDSAQTDSLKARQFINEACHLQDQALSMMSQVNRDLVKRCDAMAKTQSEDCNAKKKKVSFAAHPVVLSSDKSEKDDEDEDMEVMHHTNDTNDTNHNHHNNNDNNTNNHREMEEDEEREVEMNEDRVNAMIHRLVDMSQHYVVEELEEKMNNLLRIIYRYSNEWDKSKLLDELNDHIQTYFKPKYS